MKRVGLISCASKKREAASPAANLYTSALFRKSRDYVQAYCDEWYILSAEHGLLHPTDIIQPYDTTLNSMTASKRRDWADTVWSSLAEVISPRDFVVILAGAKYREQLAGKIESYGCQLAVPMRRMGIGQQLQWLSQHAVARDK